MVIDSSVLICMLSGEAEAGVFEDAIDRDPIRMISAASVLETTLVIEGRYGAEAGRDLDLLLHEVPLDVRDFDREQLHWARLAWRKYGKGRHPAGLNFGDCFSYALAKISGEPLLFKGQDFSRTDVRSALPG